MLGVFQIVEDEKFLEGFTDSINLSDYDPPNPLDKLDPENPLNIDKLFIDWVPKTTLYEDAWMVQASLLQTYIKTGIPIVIFDRTFSLTKEEVDWVKKFNVYLFEPALNSGRNDFRYLPEWISDFTIWNRDDREYDLVYSHENVEYQLRGFEKWIKDYARIFHDKKVAYSTLNISDFKKEEFTQNNLVFLKEKYPIHIMGNMTVAFDSDEAYRIGHLNQSHFISMNMGCLPLLPVEHKYFHSIFNGLVVHDLQEMDFFVSSFGSIRNEIIEEIFERIQKEWSEFTLDHALNTIRECYE